MAMILVCGCPQVSFRLCPVPPKFERCQAVNVTITKMVDLPHKRWKNFLYPWPYYEIYGIWLIHVCEGGTLLRPLKTFLWTRTSIQVLETSNLVLSSATITIFFTLILMFNILKWPVTNGTGQVLSYALYIVSFKGSALINGTHVISISSFA